MKAFLCGILFLLLTSAKAQFDVVYWYNKGHDNLELGFYKRAVNCFTEALALNPKSANTYCQRGNAYLALYNYKAAIIDFETAAKLEPKELIYINDLKLAIAADLTYFTPADTAFTLDSLLYEAGKPYRISHPIIENFLDISINLLQLPINEVGIYVDYFFAKKHSIGFGVGEIYANNAFKVNVLSGDQGTYPGTVWNGFVARVNYKNYFTHTKRCYVAAQLMYKKLSYQNQSFENIVDHDNANYFVRSEHASLLGLDCFFGYHLTKPQSDLNIELFYGIGFRYRIRNYTTISSTYPSPGISGNVQPVGTYVLNQTYPTIIVGLKFGFRSYL